MPMSRPPRNAATTQPITRRSGVPAGSASALLQAPHRAAALALLSARRTAEHPVALHRPLALDDALGDVAHDHVGDVVDARRLEDDGPSKPGVLEEAVGAPVAVHHHEGGHVDPEPRRRAAGDVEDEGLVVLGDLGEDASELVGEHLQPGALGVAKLDHDVGTLRLGRPDAPDGVLQAPDGAPAASVERVAHSAQSRAARYG